MPMHPGHGVRRWLVFSSALALAGLATAGWLVVRGAGASLRLAEERLGADILVVPAGAVADVEAALLMGGPVYATMPEDNVQRIAAVGGVAAVSPQLYLSSPPQSSPQQPALLLVACDPAREPGLHPWLSGAPPGSLATGSAVGGASVAPSDGDGVLWLCGSPLRLVGRLAPTGTHLDRSLFVSLETAHQLARQSYALAPQPLEMPLTGISAALVRLRRPGDLATVASEIEAALPGVSAIPRADLFAGFRRRAAALGRRLLAGLAVATGLAGSLLLARARRPSAALATTLAMAASGAALGVALAAPAVWLLRDALIDALRLPVQLPPPGSLVALSGAALALAAASRVMQVWAESVRSTRAGLGQARH